MRSALLVGLLLSGCSRGPAYPRGGVYEEAVELTLQTWPRTVSDQCQARARDVRLRVVGDDGIEEHCRRCAPGRCGPNGNPACAWGCAAGCMLYGDPIVVVTHRATPEVFGHELVHGLAACEGGGADRGHSDPELWGPGGVRQQAEALWRR